MENNPKINKQTLRIYWQALNVNKRLFYTSLLLPVGVLLLNTGLPLVIGRMIASLAQPEGDPYTYIPVLFVVAMLGVTANRYGFRAFLQITAVTMSQLTDKVYTSLIQKSTSFHNNSFSGKLVSDAITYSSSFQSIFTSTMGTFLPFLITFLGGLFIIFPSSWQLGLIVLAMGILAFGSSYIFNVARRPQRTERIEARRALNGHLSDSIINIESVVTFANENFENKIHKKLQNKFTGMLYRDWTTAANFGNYRIMVLLILQFMLVVVMVNSIQNNPELLSIGIFTLIFAATFFVRFFDLDAFARQVEEAVLQAAPMTEVLVKNHSIQDSPNAKPLNLYSPEIAFNNVQFKYQDNHTSDHVFENLSFTVNGNQSVGVVGPSGGGKTTLTKLLLRFEELSGGTITISGQDISEITQKSLRRNISYVPQDPLLFHRSISDNVSYGRINASDGEIINACKLAYADDFINELPDGYNTFVGERGVKLSGGQRQRIAIARAILKDSPILVLDEATSSLDSESEQYIQKALGELMKNRTTIIVAHRLSTIQKMDRILVIDNGKVVEDGPHSRLIKKSGTYAKLWKHQSGGFIKD